MKTKNSGFDDDDDNDTFSFLPDAIKDHAVPCHTIPIPGPSIQTHMT
jgi:hypothetical protein